MKFGSAFSDNVIQGAGTTRLFSSRTELWWMGTGRVLLFISILFGTMFILFWRLFHLTVIRGHEYRLLADGNRTKELIRHAPRGIFTDRTGKPLVENIPHYRLIRPCEVGSGKEGTACVTRISEEEGKSLQQKGLPSGWFLEVDYERKYLYAEATAHVLGYTNELSQKELEDQFFYLRGYRASDRIGRVGAEAVFEDRLRGRNGRELVEVDAEGHILRTIGQELEIPGENVQLSLDLGLSIRAKEVFPSERKGAVIVSRPETGEILALFSSPSYSTNSFSMGMSEGEYQKLTTDANKPMFNRAIGGVYPPGSIFKLVTSLAGLEEGVVKKNTIVEDVGVITIGAFTFPNWFFKQYGKTDGNVDIVKALARSNDIFFYKVGEWLGITKLAQWAKTIGLGKPTGIELAGEASGLMPDPEWKKLQFTTALDQENRNDEWYLGDTYHVAIGQGYLLTTPLQGNMWTNVIANGGFLCTPTIEKISNNALRPRLCKNLHIAKETIDLITKGMQGACATGGTGWPLFDFRVKRSTESGELQTVSLGSQQSIAVPLACKTGTAEFGDPNNKTHAWFTAFAPLPASVVTHGESDSIDTISGEPELTITVLVEEAGEGSDKAAPIAKALFEEWFHR